MKYYHIEKIPVELTVLSPVCIGGGEKGLNKKFCALSDNKLLIPDVNKLTEFLYQKGLLLDFESFVQGSAQEGLETFLRKKGLPIASDQPWVAYSLEYQEKKLNDLILFIKDFEGNPYIPGSSLKGAFRTAMLAGRPMKTFMFERSVQNGAESQGAEEYPLRTLKCLTGEKDKYNAVNDLFKGLALSDSDPLPLSCLTVCRKEGIKFGQEIKKDQQRNPVLRECLKPSTKAHFSISVDTSLFPLIYLEELKKALQKRSDDLAMRYENRFQEASGFPMVLPGETPLILGAGAGFQSKSLVYSLSNYKEMEKVVHNYLKWKFSNTYKRFSDSAPVPYTLKVTRYNGKLYPFGHCCLKW